MPTFGQRFKTLRLEQGLNQKELIEDFNEKYHYSFTKSAVSQYENDKRIPEIDALSDFASYFNVSIDYLLGKSNHRKSAMDNEDISHHDINKYKIYSEMINKLENRLIREGIIDDGNPITNEIWDIILKHGQEAALEILKLKKAQDN
ncbi:helix-turn-helix domain-containing protein [Wukongibacter sp. M2B1]|uniref:helix-turn-helix domain-containing protein n=1 Tax=Wukongibacter sp. M2B1 TaxID=3088895 RepID=UPI003D7BDD34